MCVFPASLSSPLPASCYVLCLILCHRISSVRVCICRDCICFVILRGNLLLYFLASLPLPSAGDYYNVALLMYVYYFVSFAVWCLHRNVIVFVIYILATCCYLESCCCIHLLLYTNINVHRYAVSSPIPSYII